MWKYFYQPVDKYKTDFSLKLSMRYNGIQDISMFISSQTQLLSSNICIKMMFPNTKGPRQSKIEMNGNKGISSVSKLSN